MAEANSMLEWALWYEQQGCSVIPIPSGSKIPRVSWKAFQQKPFPSPSQIKNWWTEEPNADIGIITGAAQNRLVLDVDGEEGRKSLEGKKLPSTMAVQTPRGKHYHFSFPTAFGCKTTVVGVLPGIDTRGEGGYVKMPPSMGTGTNRYEFIGEPETPLAYPPEWLLRLLDSPQREEKESERVNWLEKLLEGVGEGERHGALVRLAGYYFNCMAPDVAEAHLRDWNKKNSPPYGEEELKQQVQDLRQRFTKGEYASHFLQQPKDFHLITVEEMVEKHSSRIEYLVEGLIPKASSCIFGGWQGIGKTLCVTDLITEISRKKGSGKWLGTFGVGKGPVIYVDNEMGGNLSSYRLKQILTPKGLVPGDLNLYYATRNRVKLTNEQHYLKLKKEIERIKPVLVVVDSMASCHTLDENTSKDMRHFFDDLIAPLCDEYKCCFMMIDHEAKGLAGVKQIGSKRLRGSGAKGDAVDTMISLDFEDGVVVFEHAKARYSKKHPKFGIEIQDVPNGLEIKNIGYF